MPRESVLGAGLTNSRLALAETLTFLEAPNPPATNSCHLHGGRSCVPILTKMRRQIPQGWSSDRLLDVIVHESKDYAYLLCDREGKITFANRGAEMLLGCSEAVLLTRTACEFFVPEDQAHGVPGEEQKRATQEGSVVDERWHLRADGTRFWATGVTAAVRDDASRVVGFLKVIRNQTARKKTEDKIQQERSELIQFAAIASHDMKEPLRNVTSYLQLLQRSLGDRLEGDAKGYLQVAVESARRMHALVDDMLGFARADSEGGTFQLTECNAAFDVAVESLRVAIESSEARVSRGVLPTLIAVPSQLQRLFQNLVGNAVKFRGSAAPIVFVSAERVEAEWIFSVKDNGIGIPADQHERIFEPFKRLHTRTEFPGSGLGLAACRRIVELHGGRIWVESEMGNGTTFFVALPLHQQVDQSSRPLAPAGAERDAAG